MPVKVYAPERVKERDDLGDLVKIASIGNSIAGISSGKAGAKAEAPIESEPAEMPDFLGARESTNLNSAYGAPVASQTPSYLGTKESTNLGAGYGTETLGRRMETLKFQNPSYLVNRKGF